MCQRAHDGRPSGTDVAGTDPNLGGACAGWAESVLQDFFLGLSSSHSPPLDALQFAHRNISFR